MAPLASCTSAAITLAPSATNRSTVPRPMPEHPPVIRATLPSRRPDIRAPPDYGRGLEGAASNANGGRLARAGEDEGIPLGILEDRRCSPGLRAWRLDELHAPAHELVVGVMD